MATFSTDRTAYEFRDMVVAGVAAGNFTVVCDGITKDILPEINEDNIPETHPFPYGPHTAGNYEVQKYIVKRFTTLAYPFIFRLDLGPSRILRRLEALLHL